MSKHGLLLPVHLYTFCSMSIGEIPAICFLFNISPWKSKVKVISPWCCTTASLDNSIELQTVWIHPVVLQICVQYKVWTPVLPSWFDNFLANGANYYDVAQLHVKTIPQKISSFIDMHSTKSGSCPPTRTSITIIMVTPWGVKLSFLYPMYIPIKFNIRSK